MGGGLLSVAAQSVEKTRHPRAGKPSMSAVSVLWLTTGLRPLGPEGVGEGRHPHLLCVPISLSQINDLSQVLHFGGIQAKTEAARAMN